MIPLLDAVTSPPELNCLHASYLVIRISFPQVMDGDQRQQALTAEPSSHALSSSQGKLTGAAGAARVADGGPQAAKQTTLLGLWGEGGEGDEEKRQSCTQRQLQQEPQQQMPSQRQMQQLLHQQQSTEQQGQQFQQHQKQEQQQQQQRWQSLSHCSEAGQSSKEKPACRTGEGRKVSKVESEAFPPVSALTAIGVSASAIAAVSSSAAAIAGTGAHRTTAMHINSNVDASAACDATIEEGEASLGTNHVPDGQSALGQGFTGVHAKRNVREDGQIVIPKRKRTNTPMKPSSSARFVHTR